MLRREIRYQRVLDGAVQALTDAEEDDHAAEGDHGGGRVEPEAHREDGGGRRREERRRQRDCAHSPPAFERLCERELGEHDQDGVDQEDHPDPGLAHSRVVRGVGREHRRDLGVRRRDDYRDHEQQPDERAVAKHDRVAARDAGSGRQGGLAPGHKGEDGDEGEERARVEEEEQLEARGHLRRGDQAADQRAGPEAEVVRRALERVGSVPLLPRGEGGEQARVARREAAVTRAGNRGEPVRLPRMVEERKASVADGQQPERAHQCRARADQVDEAPGEGRRDEGHGGEARDNCSGVREPEVPHFVQIDDQEGENNSVPERVGDAARFEKPDRTGQLRIQSAQVRGDGFHAREERNPESERCLVARLTRQSGQKVLCHSRPESHRSFRFANLWKI